MLYTGYILLTAYLTLSSIQICLGEHIDYCGYAVFPMALEQDIVFAVSSNNDGMYRMENTNSRFG